MFVFSPAPEVSIIAGAIKLNGCLEVPPHARGVVLFAPGLGSGRHSVRNEHVAAALRREGLATLLLDLLTPEEEEVDLGMARLRFDIVLLAARLRLATAWARAESELAGLPVGYFGASTGAAVALMAAAAEDDRICAVVSRGGRPDLAEAVLPLVDAPTLLIVGSADPEILALNHGTFDRLRTEKRLEVVAGAGHLFEEPGALDTVATLAGNWFLRHLPR